VPEFSAVCVRARARKISDPVKIAVRLAHNRVEEKRTRKAPASTRSRATMKPYVTPQGAGRYVRSCREAARSRRMAQGPRPAAKSPRAKTEAKAGKRRSRRDQEEVRLRKSPPAFVRSGALRLLATKRKAFAPGLADRRLLVPWIEIIARPGRCSGELSEGAGRAAGRRRRG